MQWGATGQVLVPVQTGEVKVTWVAAEEGQEGQVMVSAAYRRFVEGAARAVAAATAQEVSETGFGRQSLVGREGRGCMPG